MSTCQCGDEIISHYELIIIKKNILSFGYIQWINAAVQMLSN